MSGPAVGHVPGYCPGRIRLEMDDVLLTADPALSRMTPHQSTAEIMPFGGLERYPGSLVRIRERARPGVYDEARKR